MAFAEQDIFDFKVGTVVLNKDYIDRVSFQRVDMYGHIQGFTLNNLNEVLFIVLWATGDTTSIHPSMVHKSHWRG